MKKENFNNMVMSNKFLNILTYILAGIFLLFFIFAGISINNRDIFYSQYYEAMLRNVALYNENAINSGTSSDGNNQEDSSKSMFKNAKEAFLYTFDLFNKSTSYDVKVKGKTITSAVGQDVFLDLASRHCQYREGAQLSRSLSYETKTNFGQTGGREVYYIKGRRYDRPASNISDNNGDVTADYVGNFVRNTTSAVTSHPFYVINDLTVTDNIYFYANRDKKGNITGYYASVALSTYTSVINYAKEIKEQGGTSLPVFSKIHCHAIIDASGNLISFSADENMTATIKIFGLTINANITNRMDYFILSINEEPEITEPRI